MRLYMPRGNLDSLNTARSDYANFGIAAGLLYAYNLLDAWLFTGAATGAALENREKQIYTFFTTTGHDRMQAGFMMRF